MPLSPKLLKSLSHQTPNEAQQGKIECLRLAAKVFGNALEASQATSREQSLAITKLEESLMWAIKGIVLEAK